MFRRGTKALWTSGGRTQCLHCRLPRGSRMTLTSAGHRLPVLSGHVQDMFVSKARGSCQTACALLTWTAGQGTFFNGPQLCRACWAVLFLSVSATSAWTVLTARGRDITPSMWVGEEPLWYDPAIPVMALQSPSLRAVFVQVGITKWRRDLRALRRKW